MTDDRGQRTDKSESTIRDVEDLMVYRKAYAISLEIHAASLQLPRVEQFGLAEQMRRASKSICANLAEGFGKQSASKAEFKRFLLMAMGSADEMKVWLSYCADLSYIEKLKAGKWREEYRDIAKMLNGLHQKWG
jgi:four helix bundle protein